MTTIRLHTLLGIKDLPANGMAWHDLIVEGFHPQSLTALASHLSISEEELLANFGETIPVGGTRLSIPLSNVLYRLARALRELQAVNRGDVGAAYGWLQTRQAMLKGRVPVGLLLSQLGTEFVMTAISRLVPAEPPEVPPADEDADEESIPAVE